MNHNHYCVIMAGGTGNSFWPASREGNPKEFLAFSGVTYLKITYDRFSKIVPAENILIVTQDRLCGKVREILPELPGENLLGEPYSRHTTPCMLYAAYTILKRNPDAVIVATPADHIIPDEDPFREAIHSAMDYVTANPVLMTIGIKPEGPSPDFGYIQVKGGPHLEDKSPVKVKTFTEKPSVALAEAFISSGEFYWNSGIYVWTAKQIKKEIETLVPEVAKMFVGWENNLGTDSERAFIERCYSECPKVSLDYGVMEKTEDAWLYPGGFSWMDIGNWVSYYRFMPKDANGNVIRADKTLLSECRNNVLALKNRKKLIAAKGLEDFVIIDTDDVLMICPRNEKIYRECMSSIALPEYEEFR